MAKPVEYLLRVPGFGSWRIAYAPGKKKWELAYSVRFGSERWVPCGDYLIAETAAIAVAERNTGAPSWDGLRFALPANTERLVRWKTDASDGVQSDAAV